MVISMKIVKYKKIKDNRYEILFDDNKTLILFDDVIIKFNLLALTDLDNKLMLSLKKYNNEKEAYYKSLKYISKKLRSEKEIKSYLKKLEYDNQLITKTIIDLKKDGYLKKEVYINAYVNDSLTLSKKGPYRILKELENLGFKEEDINKSLLKIEENIWLERIENFINKKINSNTNKGSRILKEKIIKDLIYLGYKTELINIKINDVDFNDSSIIKKEVKKLKNKLSRKYSGTELNWQIKNKLYTKGFSADEINNLFEID